MLNLIFQNKALIEATAIANGGSSFGNSWYWSSTETDVSSEAWEQNFVSGEQGDQTKTGSSRVRAVRRF